MSTGIGADYKGRRVDFRCERKNNIAIKRIFADGTDIANGTHTQMSRLLGRSIIGTAQN
jgi:hypothetical protein